MPSWFMPIANSGATIINDMKLLVFYPYLPYPLDRGTYHRTFNLLKELAGAHEVDLLALTENGEGEEHKHVFAEFCNKVETISFKHPDWQKMFPDRLLNPLPPNVAHWTLPQVEPVVDRLLTAGKYDAVHVCDIVLAQYFTNKKRASIPMIVDRSRVDLQFQLAEHSRMNFSLKTRFLRYEGYAKLLAFEKKVAARAAMEVVCGPDDKVFIQKYISKKVPIEVVVNGVDLDYFRESPIPTARAQNPSLIFCGAMDYNPNVDALRWYFEAIHEGILKQIPNLQVLIVGKSPIPEVKAYGEKPGVHVTGGVPDVRPYYGQAWLQIVPLRIGGGTRLKIVESMALGTPVISTTIGAQGLDLIHKQDILLADTPETFITETVEALKDESLRKRLSIAAIETASQRLSWRTIGKRLAELYDRKFKSRNANPITPPPQALFR
ncbi:MAG: hypothetical protein JWM04_2831 [Verrucomicrobiales bacterium]|nr:hypothetical protein [Verrucomicrobiales bacterium]